MDLRTEVSVGIIRKKKNQNSEVIRLSGSFGLKGLKEYFKNDPNVMRILKNSSIPKIQRIRQGNAIRFSVMERGNRKANESFNTKKQESGQQATLF